MKKTETTPTPPIPQPNIVEEKPKEEESKPEFSKTELNKQLDDLIIEEPKKEVKKFVKVTKVKENLTKYTPQYSVSNSNIKDDEQQKSLLNSDMFKNPEIEQSKISMDNYKVNKNAMVNEQLDLSGIKSKLDTHFTNTKKVDKQFEQDWAKLHSEFNKVNDKKNKDLNDYRQRVLELQEEQRKKELEKELKGNDNMNKFNSKINKK